MTTISFTAKTCIVCRAEHEYTEIDSTMVFDSPDLDSRPPEMMRSTIFAWVQCCPACGYCAEDVSKAPKQAKVIVKSTQYQAQLADPAMPEMANHFLCQAMIHEHAGDYAAAAWAIVHAARVCDDEEKSESAKICRIRAANMVLRAIAAGQEFTEQRGAETVIPADLLRRAGAFAEARTIIARRRPGITDSTILRLLAFQDSLIARGDVARHTLDEAMGEDE